MVLTGRRAVVRRPVEILTLKECESLIGVCSRRSPAGIRNAAIIVVLWRCGLRVSELTHLEVKDVDLDQHTISVLHGKGDRQRVAVIDPRATAVVQHWLTTRLKLKLRSRWVFCTFSKGHRGGPVSDRYIRAMLKRLAVRADIEKRVHPHGFRHTHTVELVREGVPLNVVRKQLGHSTLAVTHRYADHISSQDVVDALKDREWG